MKRGLSYILFFFLATTGQVLAQTTLIKYVSNEGGREEGHYIELFNAFGGRVNDLSGYWLVNRDYLFRIPPNVRIRPIEKLRIGIGPLADAQVDMLNYPEYYQPLTPNSIERGNFIALLAPDLRILDAFFFGSQKDVGFLPFSAEVNVPGRGMITIEVPDENDIVWRNSFIQSIGDPALAFVYINGAWTINSRQSNMLPATVFGAVNATYTPEGVKLIWQTEQERDCYSFEIERSRDGNRFEEIGAVPANGNTESTVTYAFTDSNVVRDITYFYRIKNIDKFGEVLYSDYKSVETTETPSGLSLDILNTRQELSVRFSSVEEQLLRVKLLDEAFREVDILFYGTISANTENLIKYTRNLPVGKYYLVAHTPTRRVFESFIVE